MRSLIISILFLISSTGFSQDYWTVRHGSRLLLNPSKEDTSKNVIVFHRSDLKKNYLFVSFNEKKKEKAWQRTISAEDPDGNDLIKKDDHSLKISDAVLKQWFKKNSTIKIYTWALPIDPKLRAGIRVRRLHLCTIVLQ